MGHPLPAALGSLPRPRARAAIARYPDGMARPLSQWRGIFQLDRTHSPATASCHPYAECMRGTMIAVSASEKLRTEVHRADASSRWAQSSKSGLVEALSIPWRRRSLGSRPWRSVRSALFPSPRSPPTLSTVHMYYMYVVVSPARPGGFSLCKYSNHKLRDASGPSTSSCICPSSAGSCGLRYST